MQQSTQQELLYLVEVTLGTQVCTDLFSCRQRTVAPRFATPLHCRHSAAFNGLLLDWSPVFTLWLNPRRAFRQSRGATAGSGLRLCVKDEVLQVCVLLTPQGVHSRIRWSSSQDCQHVISSDIRPYNKKLLGTSTALHQEVTLPANFMMRTISPTSPVFEVAE